MRTTTIKEHSYEYGYYIADPPAVTMTNVVMVRPVKSNPEEFSFAGVNLTFLLVIIVLSILCLNVLIIGITVTICRLIIFICVSSNLNQTWTTPDLDLT